MEQILLNCKIIIKSFCIFYCLIDKIFQNIKINNPIAYPF